MFKKICQHLFEKTYEKYGYLNILFKQKLLLQNDMHH